MKTIVRHILWMTTLLSIRLVAQPPSCGLVVNTGSNHSILLINLKPTLDGAPLPLGSYISVLFDDNGTLKCAGYVQWNGVNTAMAAFGDDGTTTEKDGFAANELFVYRVQLPNGNTVGPACISVKYATGGIFSNAGSFAENGISGLAIFEARTAACPNLCLDVGDHCDDGNDATVNDVVTANCTCQGAPSAVTIYPYAVSNAGGYQVTGNYSLAWTLGQVVGKTLDTIVDEAMCYWLRQGFQQPFEWLATEPVIECAVSTIELPERSVSVQVFPNPFSGAVTVFIEQEFPHVWSLRSPDGRTVLSGKSGAVKYQIELGMLSAGMYFFKIEGALHGESAVVKLAKY